MSDHPSHEQGAPSLPELTAEQEEQVRRLLAEARHDEPVPADVAARLDAVLADLPRDGSLTSGSSGIAPVVDLAARRRRRNAAALLAGAAAVIVAGFGIGQVIDVGDPSDDGADSTAQSADRTDKSGLDSTAGGVGAPETTIGAEAPLALSSGDLEDDVTRELQQRTAAPPEAGAVPQPVPGYACAPAPADRYGIGALFPALFDGEPAVLALRPPTGTTQQADVLACGTADQLASVTITPR